MKTLLKKVMSFQSGTKSVSEGIKDEQGVAAIEFALIAPLLLLLFVGTVETSYGVSIDRKVSRTASVIADLVTQAPELTVAEVKAFMTVASKVIAPYDTIPCIVISGIEIENDAAKIVWSYDNNDEAGTSNCTPGVDPNARARRARTVDTEYPVPAAIKINDTFLIAAEIELDHSPIVGILGYGNGISKDNSAITLGDQILLRPRIGDSITINP